MIPEFGVYAPFIWAGYGVSIVGFAALICHTVWTGRRATSVRAQLEENYDLAAHQLNH